MPYAILGLSGFDACGNIFSFITGAGIRNFKGWDQDIIGRAADRKAGQALRRCSRRAGAS